MSTVVVDTDIFSFVFKGDDRARLYRPHLDGNEVVLSFMTVAELYRWSLVRGWGARRVETLYERIRACTIVEPDDEMLWHWAALTSVKGRPMGASDAWVAATALRLRSPLVTHNRSDFEGITDLRVISEA